MSEEPRESLTGRTFHGRSLRGSRFVECDLTDVVVRGGELAGLELDSAWLFEGGQLLVNGVDVVPLVDAELNARFPGRELRGAADPVGMRTAWAAVEAAWAAVVQRATALPSGSVDVSVAGEWSFAQTLRHLVTATDCWLGKAVLEREQPFDPIGLPNDDGEGSAAFQHAEFTTSTPDFAEVLRVRAHRQGMVRDFLAEVTEANLAEQRRNPHALAHEETVLSCLHTIIEEEWEHLRYAVRDLDALAAPDSGRG